LGLRPDRTVRSLDAHAPARRPRARVGIPRSRPAGPPHPAVSRATDAAAGRTGAQAPQANSVRERPADAPWITSVAQAVERTVARPMVQDAAIAVVLTSMALIGVLTHLKVDLPEGGSEEAFRSLDALGIGLILLQTAPLAWRRKAPVAVLAVITTALFLFGLLGYFRSFASFGFLVALYTVAAHRERRISIPAGIIAASMILVLLVIGAEPLEPDAFIAEVLIAGSAWFIGDGFRVRRGQVDLLEDRASRLEREQEALTQAAVGEERRLISRELHDVVAHNMSVIVAQAAGAQRISAAHPDEAIASLDTIERTGREALVEMRRLMGLLRTETEREEMRSLQPGLGNLELLVEQAREAGIPITLRLEGEQRALSAGLDLSAFRIVQEAITNVLKHAGPAQVQVVVRYETRRLMLTVVDDGAGTGTPMSLSRRRYGHLGMRERVALFGGELRVGPRPGGGYQVVAILPLEGDVP
jgi:signal transduction histidine kinase